MEAIVDFRFLFRSEMNFERGERKGVSRLEEALVRFGGFGRGNIAQAVFIHKIHCGGFSSPVFWTVL
jgi:hypothetical protein